ncbi:MAG: type II secretion system protein [Blastocatellia bacterium]|nr:type II secretion system protein [Blastocatellia bacterium]MBL8193670.1 type II secretion system protein [Blastocatellia bacterium]MBN8723797.1 type II secretion system protein [Acidobacteriota bacterium]
MSLKPKAFNRLKSLKSTSSGFSLIELLMVTVVVLILCSLATLNLMSAKIAANEASATATLKTFLQANYTYYISNDSFATPGQLAAAGYVGEEFGKMEVLSCGKTVFNKSGYAFVMVPTKLERRISKQNKPSSNKSIENSVKNSGGTNNGNSGGTNGGGTNGGGTNNGNSGGGNNSSEEIVILEYLMDALPISEFKPHAFKTGIRWFYIDSITNTLWTIKDPKRFSACSPGEFCYDLQKQQPKYEDCSPIN